MQPSMICTAGGSRNALTASSRWWTGAGERSLAVWVRRDRSFVPGTPTVWPIRRTPGRSAVRVHALINRRDLGNVRWERRRGMPTAGSCLVVTVPRPCSVRLIHAAWWSRPTPGLFAVPRNRLFTRKRMINRVSGFFFLHEMKVEMNSTLNLFFFFWFESWVDTACWNEIYNTWSNYWFEWKNYKIKCVVHFKICFMFRNEEVSNFPNLFTNTHLNTFLNIFLTTYMNIY